MKSPRKLKDNTQEKSPGKIRNRLLIAGTIAVVVIAVVFFLAPQLASPRDAGTLYTKSLDLANAANYNEALANADQALALNPPNLVPLIQANRARILVELGRNKEASAAADAAFLTKGNLTTPQAIEATRFQEAGAFYTKSVDLANAGSYNEALSDADQALALNATSLIPLIQANRAGILVALGRNNEAVTAADAAISAKGNLTALQSIAWFNKGNALRNLGRLEEAKAAYANATALDPTLEPPVT